MNDGSNYVRGEATDPLTPELGMIKYQGDKDGYQFWLRPTESFGRFTAGHLYHSVYKLQIDDSNEWCDQTVLPNRHWEVPSKLDTDSQFWEKTREVKICVNTTSNTNRNKTTNT